jgi:hypothetical protein
MSGVDAKELAREIQRLYEEEYRDSFPYDGCRYLVSKDEKRFEGLISELDFYTSTVAGYCSWATRIPTLPRGKLQEIRSRITNSFFEEYPQYGLLEPQITRRDTSDLFEQLTLLENMRMKLLELLTLLLDEQ